MDTCVSSAYVSLFNRELVFSGRAALPSGRALGWSGSCAGSFAGALGRAS